MRGAACLFPLYYGALIVFFLVAQLAFSTPPADWQWHLDRQLSYWLYLQNWEIAALGNWPRVAYINHFWTLNIEEQFYLLWPLAAYGMGRRRLMQFCVVLLLASATTRLALTLVGSSWKTIYVLTPAHLDGLVAGSWLAALRRGPNGFRMLVAWRRWPLVACTAVIVLCSIRYGRFHPMDPPTMVLGHSAVVLLFCLLLVSALSSRQDSLLRRVLSAHWLSLLGQRSYAVYVAHWPIVVYWMGSGRGRVGVPGLTLPAGTLTYALQCVAVLSLSLLAASLSWRFLEGPCLRLKRHFPFAGS
jgi:peptidoglycan/LPS O-acetylase OafA/YrhL